MRRPDPAPGRSRLLVFPRSGCEAGTHQISLCKSLKNSESSLVIPAGDCVSESSLVIPAGDCDLSTWRRRRRR